MEIIKHGDAERLKETKYFICKKCGCEWKADNTEYKIWSSQIEGTFCMMKCPCCNTTTYNDFNDHNQKEPYERKIHRTL